MRKLILYNCFSFFAFLFVSCTSFSDTDEMKLFCNSYMEFSKETDFVYDMNFLLSQENANIILSSVNNFIESLELYRKNTDNIYFNRLSSSSETFNSLAETVSKLKRLMEIVISNPDKINKESNHRSIILFNQLHQEMYSIEFDRVQTSESIISDYIKYFMIFIVFFFVLCIVLLGIFLFELKQRDLKIIETSKFLNYTIKGQEEEKQRIARELHDTIAQDIRYIIQLTKHLDTSPEQLDILKRQEDCLKQVRELCSSFIPQDIENKDLVASLNDIFVKIKTETNIEPKLTILNDINFKEMDSDRFLNFFRIIQEILTNAQKHSKASEISVLIKREIINEEKYIHLIITDDGIGIDKQILDSINQQQINTTKNHFGLKNIIQRTRLLAGEINFTSDKDFGTEINLIFKE